MKKILSLIMLVSVVFGLALPMAATGEEYEILEWGITVTIPEGYDIIDENISPDHLFFDVYGMEKSEYLDMLEECGIFFDMVSSNAETEIYVSIYDAADSDYNMYNDAELAVYAQGLAEEYRAGYSIEDYGVHRINQFKFATFSASKGDLWCTEYVTCYNNIMIWITMESYAWGQSLDKAKKTLIDFIVDMSLQKWEDASSYMGGRHDICDGQLTITLPDDYYVIHHGIPKYVDTVEVWGSSRDYFLDMLASYDIVLMGMPTDGNCNLTVTCTENAEYDYSSMSRADMELAKEAIKFRLEQKGCIVKELKECRIDNYKGLYVIYYDTAEESDFVSCFTTIDGKYININVTPASSDISPEHENLFFEIFDDFAFTDTGNIFEWLLLPSVSNLWKIVLVLIVGSILICVTVAVIVLVIVRKNKRKREASVVSTAEDMANVSECKYCPMCGKKLEMRYEFCSNCGKKQ